MKSLSLKFHLFLESRILFLQFVVLTLNKTCDKQMFINCNHRFSPSNTILLCLYNFEKVTQNFHTIEQIVISKLIQYSIQHKLHYIHGWRFYVFHVFNIDFSIRLMMLTILSGIFDIYSFTSL